MRARPALWVGLVVAAGVLVVYARTLAPGLTWANHGADGGDLITAAATFGVAHPSGYPTYLLLARLFQALPLGTLAYRTNLLSAIAAALAAGLMVPLVDRAYVGPRIWGLAGGVLAGAGFGLSPLLWSQAVITEVHALHALFAALLLWTLPHGEAPAISRRMQLGAGLIAGLALGNHLTTALLLPAWLWLSARGRAGWRPGWAWRLAGLALGLAVYAYVPLAASTQPPVNWGNAVTREGFWWLVSGAPYRALAFGLPPDFVGGRLQGWAGLLIGQFGWLGLLAGLAGLFLAPARWPAARPMTIWTLLACSAFAIGYDTADSTAYLLPAIQALALWMGVGAAAGLSALERWPRPALTRAALVGALALGLAVNAARAWPTVDASRDGRAEAFGSAVMAAARPRAVVVTQADQDSFALWYFHYALGQRPDLAVVVEPLLAFPWYLDTLRAAYPDLVLALGASEGWRAALAASGRPVCDAQLSAPTGLACVLP